MILGGFVYAPTSCTRHRPGRQSSFPGRRHHPGPDSGSGAAPVVDIDAFEAPPGLVAYAAGPYVVLQGQSISLFGQGASDAAGPLAYAWDFNDDGLFDDVAGPNPVFSVTSPPANAFPVALRVTDTAGHSTLTTASVRIAPLIANVDPRASGGANDGIGWANAFTNLSDALAVALAPSPCRA